MTSRGAGHRDDWYLMANARRITIRPIAEVKNYSNAQFARELFATGSTSSYQICIDAGIDPDGKEILRGTQPAYKKTLAMPPSWCFCMADMSIIASGGTVPGSVTLIRCPSDRAAWHRLSGEPYEHPPLYVYGRGMTIDEAMQDAIKNALAAPPITTITKDKHAI